MQTVNEIIRLLQRREALEAAMRKPGGIRITEEQELVTLRQRLTQYPAATQAVLQAAHALGRPVTEVTAREVVDWANVEHRMATPNA